MAAKAEHGVVNGDVVDGEAETDALLPPLSLSVFLPHTCCESDIKTLANLAWKCHKNAAAASLARIADIVSFKLNLMGRTRPHLLLVVSSFR